MDGNEYAIERARFIRAHNNYLEPEEPEEEQEDEWNPFEFDRKEDDY